MFYDVTAEEVRSSIQGDAANAQRSLDEIVRFMEGHTDAELTEVER